MEHSTDEDEDSERILSANSPLYDRTNFSHYSYQTWPFHKSHSPRLFDGVFRVSRIFGLLVAFFSFLFFASVFSFFDLIPLLSIFFSKLSRNPHSSHPKRQRFFVATFEKRSVLLFIIHFSLFIRPIDVLNVQK